MSTRLAIVGSRTFNDFAILNRVIDDIIDESGYNVTKIVSGGARGADELGERYAEKYGIEKLIFKADWKRFGKRAGFIRNVDIIKNCDVCICFWNGDSHGTLHDIQLCFEHEKECYVYNFNTGKLNYNSGQVSADMDVFIEKCKI